MHGFYTSCNGKSVLMTYLPFWILLNGMMILNPCHAQLKLKPNLTTDAVVVVLDQNQADPVTLTEIQCADPDGGVAVVFTDKVSPGKPCGHCFNIVPCNTVDYCLVFTRLEELDMIKVNAYTVTIKCIAENKQAVKSLIQVRLSKKTKPPEFKTFQKVVTLDETATQEVILQKVTCTDPDNTAVKVDLSVDTKVSKSACSKCFSIEPCGTEWCLKYIPGVGSISFSLTPIYPMTLTCTDGEGQTVTSDIEVRVTKNSPPYFGKRFASTTIAGTSHIKAGTKLFRVNATDQEKDALFYTMKTNPDVPQISIGFTDGTIVTTGDLSQVCIPVVSCEIMVSDGINPKVGPMVLDLTLNGANVAPSIANMDEAIQVPEDTALGSPVYKVNILDEDKISDMTLSLKANPPVAQGYFELKGNEIVVKTALDYEDNSMRTVQLSLSVTDSGGCTSPTKTVTISVTDINEPPDITNKKITMSTYEGLISVQPRWSVVDEDFVDTKHYRITKGNVSGRFAIDPNTGVITSVVDYDVDRAAMPKTVTLTVEVEDKGGLKTEGEVTLNIKDANDNAPFILGGSKHYVVSECTTPGTSLATLETDDNDSLFQFNSRTHFLPVRDGHVSLLASGELVLTSHMTVGDTASLEAWVVDAGKYPGPLKSTAPVYLTVRCVPCPTTTIPPPPQPPATPPRRTNRLPPPVIIVRPTAPPTTTTPTTKTTPVAATTATAVTVEGKKSFDNIWWMLLSGLLGLAFLSLLGWLLWKFRCCQYCRSCCCRRKPKSGKLPKLSKVRPHTPQDTKVDVNPNRPAPTPLPPPKPPNVAPALDIPPSEAPQPAVVGSDSARIYDFWKEKYNEDDYLGQPDRNSKPEPTKDAVNPLSHVPTNDGQVQGKKEDGPLAKTDKCSIS